MLLLADYQAYLDRISAGVTKRQMQISIDARIEDEMDGSYHFVGGNAIIPVTGPLSYKYDFWCWLMDGCSYQGLQAKINAAQANVDVKRIVLVVDTPGGEVTGCKETADMIARSSKPIDCIVDPMAASAGLWIASQCRKITCIESGQIGSLGVQAMVTSYHKMFEEAGIDVKMVRAAISPKKNALHPYEPMKDEAVADLQANVDKWGERFLAAVASGRKVSRQTALDKFGQGKMLDADEALEAGLIDAIGTVDSVLADSEPTSKRRTALRVERYI